jgi:hypothetical protein
MDSNINTVTVYVRLLNEGTEVFRPTRALDMGCGLFKILATPDYDPEDEEWEFLPNATVRIEMHRGHESDFPLATAP